MKNLKFFSIFLLFIFLFSFVSAYSGGYTYSNPIKATGVFASYSSSFGTTYYDTGYFNNSMCEEGTDFLLRVDSTKCTPNIVRSDLLEEESIPVFCPLEAIKINPLIDISAINSISFKGEYPKEVMTIGFTPVQSALGGNRNLESYQWDNIGYLTVILKKNDNESSMPDFIDLNLTATIVYDLKGGFGLRTHSFHLPVLDDYGFDQSGGQYAFFNNMGYLKADNIEKDSARISIYNGVYKNAMNTESYERQKLQSFELKIGESSTKLSIPSMGCLSKVQFSLKGIDYADTYANLLVGSDYVDVAEGGTFLDGKCYLKNLETNGLYNSVKITCSVDSGTSNYDLRISPKVVFNLDNKEVQVSLGDKIGRTKGGEDLFFAYLGEDKSSGEEKVLLLALPGDRGFSRLTENQLSIASYLGESGEKDKSSLGKIISGFSNAAVVGFTSIQAGQEKLFISKGEQKIYAGSEIQFIGLGKKENEVLTETIKENYELALSDYDKVISNYANEVYPTNSTNSLSKEAYVKKIDLANNLRQYEDVIKFCLDFKQNYGEENAFSYPNICDDSVSLYNQESATQGFQVGGDYIEISLLGISQPRFEDYGAIIEIKDNTKNEVITYHLGKKGVIILDGLTGESLTLNSIDENSANVYLNLNEYKSSTDVSRLFSPDQKLILEGEQTFDANNRYVFSLKKVYLNRLAHVEVKPSLNYDRSEATVNHKIGIEKRLVQLTPEKAKEIANEVNKTASTLKTISNHLEVVVETMKATCLATGGFLTLKNILTSRSGETIARGKVMVGWKEKCSKLVPTQFKTMDACYFNFSNKIDAEVKELSKVMAGQETDLNEIISSNPSFIIEKGDIFKEGLVDSNKVAEKYSIGIVEKLKTFKNSKGEIFTSPLNSNDKVNLTEVIFILEDKKLIGGVYELEDLKEMDFYYSLCVDEEVKNSPTNYCQKFYSVLHSLLIQNKNYVSITEDAKSKEEKDELVVLPYVGESAVVGTYYGEVVSSSGKIKPKGDLKEGYLIQRVRLGDGQEYDVRLRPDGIGRASYVIQGVFNSTTGESLGSEGIRKVQEVYSSFVMVNSGYYNYPISESDYVVKYYEYGEYEGFPAILPFDKANGWYVHVETGLNFISSYAESGRIQSFKLCNVMEDGLIEVVSGGEQDECVIINLAGSNKIKFGGLSERETEKLIDTAVKAISSASPMKRGSVSLINFIGAKEVVPVGEPYSQTISKSSCSDYMSPKECQILFNVCDPVICPASRCNYGGKYNVQNVIQSGLIGSIMLCLPNFHEGIYIPVCLTGINAGLEGLISVTEAYRDCLIESADTGKTVGICDEIHSIYLCEFLWKQAIPLVKIVAPKVLENILEGGAVRGGGEYYSIKDALENAQSSIDYFTQTYAIQSYKAFKVRSTDQVGTDICKNFISIVFPTDLGSLIALTESDSPSQFISSFEEIPYTTTTNPPMSQYKVYYHIYAGEDIGAYYSIYLRGSGSSYYEDTNIGRRVDSGYIEKGRYASETIDFLGPSGYTELCVRINDQEEECGFGKVSTDFAVNYLKDSYISNEASKTEIITADQCMSGTHNLYSLIDLNVENALSNLINQDILSQGIVRICSTTNPGVGTNTLTSGVSDRWVDVGYCGNESMRCWIDTDSLKKAFNYEYSYNDTLNSSLGDAAQTTVDKYLTTTNLWDETKFANFLNTNLSNSESPEKNITLVESIMSLLYYNNHRAKSLIIRGDAYGNLSFAGAISYFKKLDAERASIENLVDSEIEGIEGGAVKAPVFYISGTRGENLFLHYSNGHWNYTNVLRGETKEILKNSNSGTPGGAYLSSIVGSEVWIDSLKEYSKNVNLINNLVEDTEKNKEMVEFLEEVSTLDYNFGFRKMLDFLDNKRNSNFGIQRIATNEGRSILEKSIVIDNEIVSVYLSGQWIYFAYNPNFAPDYGGWVWSGKKGIKSGWKKLTEDTQEVKNTFGERINNGETWFNGEYSTYKFPEEYNFLREMLLIPGVDEYLGILILLQGAYFDSGIYVGGDDSESNRNAIFEVMNNLNGISFTKTSLGDIDGDGGINCYDSVMHIYRRAGQVDNLGKILSDCIYTDGGGREYIVGGKSYVTGSKDFSGGKYYCTDIGGSCKNNEIYPESKKLSLLKTGDILSYMHGDSMENHNVIFVKWINQDTYEAQLFDWGGTTTINGVEYKKWRFFNSNISDSTHPVYQIWSPKGGASFSVSTSYEKPLSEKKELLMEINKTNFIVSETLNFCNSLTERLTEEEISYYEEEGLYLSFANLLYERAIISYEESGYGEPIGSDSIKEICDILQKIKRKNNLEFADTFYNEETKKLLDERKEFQEKIDEIARLENKNFPVRETWDFCNKNLSGKIEEDNIENVIFVNTLHNAGIISKEDYETLTDDKFFQFLTGKPDIKKACEILLRIKNEKKLGTEDFYVKRNVDFLIDAIVNEDLNKVKELISANNSLVNERFFYGNSPLMIAASSGNLGIVQYLVEQGADLNPEDDLGFTPLMIAASSGNLEIVQYLVEQDAEVDAENNEGKTALDIALNDEIKEYLDSLN